VRASVESSIDELYKGPVESFVAGRAALARTLKGDEARQVKALQKPRVGAWAVNQLYWHARPLYERVARTGEKLRAAQIAALNGKRADLRSATEAHHKAIGDAVTEASRLAAAAGVHPGAEELIRTFEALSLARDLPERPGRLTRPLQPAGFEALAGVAVKGRPMEREPAAAAAQPPAPDANKRHQDAARQRAQAAAERKRHDLIKKAEAAVARAEAAEAQAREHWERQKQALERAVHALDSLSSKLTE
jgi:hypothetical protein